eukprot:CAMPEP_0119122790 /NCGR_PEP_ID=MMETSP1310-20130426/2945_1 /TAXON_ID=464262 /ORGANISM="Genus nov. species nov., Strain RCC2339" /LENGTH=93 /DNA_ID=CAMNT_0007112503 /DNA_START=285 /DNA_END=563 /DNA_ORIENTATION=+
MCNNRKGDQNIAVAYIYATSNETFVHITDLTGRKTIVRTTDTSSQDVAARCKQNGITALHIKLLAKGGNGTKTPGHGTQSALRALDRAGMKIA